MFIIVPARDMQIGTVTDSYTVREEAKSVRGFHRGRERTDGNAVCGSFQR